MPPRSRFAFLLGSLLALASAAVQAAPPTPMLWKLQRGGHTVYLLGSFHMLRETDYPLARSVDAAFDDAEKLVFELSPQDLESPASASLAASLARYSGGGTLSASLDAPRRKALEQLLASKGLSLAQFDALEPWFVNLMLTLGVADSLGFHPQNGLDRRLMDRGAAAHKAMEGLETVESQLRALDGTPMPEQLESLDDVLAAPEKARAELEDLHSAWRSGDVAQLSKLALDRMRRETPRTYDALLVKRNQAWLPKIEALAAGPGDDDALVVVGAMHLLGRDGLVSQLQKQGLRVEQVK